MEPRWEVRNITMGSLEVGPNREPLGFGGRLVIEGPLPERLAYYIGTRQVSVKPLGRKPSTPKTAPVVSASSETAEEQPRRNRNSK